MDYAKDTNKVHLCIAHIVFTPKYRRPVLKEIIAIRMKEIILDIAEENKWDVLEMEIMPDHVHLFIRFNPINAIHKIVKIIKGRTSNILRKEFPELTSRLPCLWTRSYFIATAGNVSQETIRKYIEEQKGK